MPRTLYVKIEKMLKINVKWDPPVNKLDKLMIAMEEAYQEGGMEAAKEVCRNTKGKYAAAAYLTMELIKKYEA